jgi:hypothetical protein
MPAHPAALPLSLSCSSGRRVASAFFGFAVIGDILAVRVTLPHAGRVEDFHVQVSVLCRAHMKKARPEPGKDVWPSHRGETTRGLSHSSFVAPHLCRSERQRASKECEKPPRSKAETILVCAADGPGHLSQRGLKGNASISGRKARVATLNGSLIGAKLDAARRTYLCHGIDRREVGANGLLWGANGPPSRLGVPHYNDAPTHPWLICWSGLGVPGDEATRGSASCEQR